MNEQARTHARDLERLSGYITTRSPQPYFPASVA
jgi:hypothetical protein